MDLLKVYSHKQPVLLFQAKSVRSAMQLGSSFSEAVSHVSRLDTAGLGSRLKAR